MNNKNWYRLRSYAHFDKSLSKKEAEHLVSNPKRVAQHAFWPLIVSPLKSFSRKRVGTGGRREVRVKYRPIAYAAHSDSHIYAYYAKKLSFYLEKQYEKHLPCSEAVLAYRSFLPKKSNIDFAFEVFEYIRDKEECEVIAIDVKGFFDSLDPLLLKKAWQQLLGVTRLPEDHYAIFKACTRSHGISIPALRRIFKKKMRRRRGVSGAVVCSPSVFRSQVVPELEPVQNLVSTIKGESISSSLKGIPQGLPISAVLANLYMFEADRVLAKYMQCLGGRYQRYSDDILLVVPVGKGRDAEKALTKKLDQLQLKVQPTKTQRLLVSHNLKSGLEVRCASSYQKSVVSYLGFDFCGSFVSVRGSTISRFMIKAVRAIKRAEIAALKNKTPIKKRQLYAKLTTLGYGRAYGRAVYKAPFILPKGAPRLGFFKYMARASKTMSSERVDLQIRQLESRVHRLIHEAESRVNLKLALSPSTAHTH